MTGQLLALILAAAVGDPNVIRSVDAMEFVIDKCIGVDETSVRDLVELEVGSARLRTISVSVTCVQSEPQIRVSHHGALETEVVRTLQLPVGSADDTQELQQARSRELALAIAEYIRRLDAPAPPEPAKSASNEFVLVKPPAPMVTRVESPHVKEPVYRWRVGAASAAELFSGGKTLYGGDIVGATAITSWLSAELGAGGRFGSSESIAGGQLLTRAATASAALGFTWYSRHRLWGIGFVMRAQGAWLRFRLEPFDAGPVRSASLGAIWLAGQPRFELNPTARFGLQLTAGGGFAPRGIEVSVNGAEVQSLSGFVLAGAFGGVIAF